jgi:hypothetical protein
MNNLTSSPRRRGAPAGNLNAVKHGFYSSRFRKTDRDALDNNEFTGLSQEIAMLRLLIRRVVHEAARIEDFYQLLETLRVVSLASSSLSHLAKTHTLIAASPSDELALALHQAIAELSVERGIKGRYSQSGYDVDLPSLQSPPTPSGEEPAPSLSRGRGELPSFSLGEDPSEDDLPLASRFSHSPN